MKKNKLICGGRLLEMVMSFYSAVERLGVLSGSEATLSFPCCQEISYLFFHPFMSVQTAKLITLVILSGCFVAFMYYAGPPEALEDWSNGFEPRWGNLDAAVAASARRHWHLVRCQNGKSR